MASKTPLLLLLDGILSQEQNQIRDAIARVTAILRKGQGTTLAMSVVASFDPAAVGVSGSLSNLPEVVSVLLEADARLASIPSTLDGSLPLHFAASLGNVQVASLLVAKYPRAVATPNSKGKLALHYASREGRTEMVAFLLHVDPSTAKMVSSKQKLPLHFAAGEGHVAVVRHLLHAHPEGASMPSSKGKLPLHFAARWGHMQIAQDLLTLHPEGVRALDWEGSLPLHDAAREGQTAMAKLLMQRHCQGLSTANLRGEIPLFTAVRSANVELVISLLQAWPRGGKHILKNVCADDDVGNWDKNILELCLRGAVGNFYNCSILEGKRTPAVCHCGDVVQSGSLLMRNDTVSGQCRCYSKKAKAALLDSATGMHSTPDRARGAAAADRATRFEGKKASCDRVAAGDPSCTDDPLVLLPRSKSPILEFKSRKKRTSTSESGGKKRSRRGSVSSASTVDQLSVEELPREFYALHAALECGASSHVLRCVLKTHAGLVTQADCFGQLPLHIAMAHSRDKDVVDVVLEEILKPYPQAAHVRNRFGQLPLHIALSSRADFKLIHGLVEANPSSGFTLCGTNDAFSHTMPLFMATESDCDLSSTYLLLRGDPSVIREFV